MSVVLGRLTDTLSKKYQGAARLRSALQPSLIACSLFTGLTASSFRVTSISTRHGSPTLNGKAVSSLTLAGMYTHILLYSLPLLTDLRPMTVPMPLRAIDFANLC